MKIFCLLFVIAATAGTVFFYGCARSNEPTLTLNKKPDGKTLVVYYSQSANQNTKIVAEWILQQTGGDFFEIEMLTPYPDSYNAVLEASKQHNEAGILPEIRPFNKDISDYDLIFIGSPIWYGTYAPPVGTFLASADWTDKTLVPFCTHGGGGSGKFYSDLAAACPGAKLLDGLAVRGSNVVERMLRRSTAHKESPDIVVEWLNQIIR
ncbi:MAG: NAD(P)H-dependent oxidoreductase [Desulfovibrionaceae bacterium]|nr:NAD(P)H-dependent oxidoreductase [Desulfovibrionaceae bacterium]